MQQIATELDVAAVRSLQSTSPNTLLVDVRTPGEFHSGHIDRAVNIPLDQVNGDLVATVARGGGRLVLVCQTGGRAEQAAAKLARAGLADIAVMAGGMAAWAASGAPVERESSARWTLERQVRLTAGLIVALSVLASIWVPWMRFLAGAIGAGLVFAAATNTCTMGMLLAKLPYNRSSDCDIDAAIARLAQ